MEVVIYSETASLTRNVGRKVKGNHSMIKKMVTVTTLGLLMITCACAQQKTLLQVADDVLTEAQILEQAYMHWTMENGLQNIDTVRSVDDLLPYVPFANEKIPTQQYLTSALPPYVSAIIAMSDRQRADRGPDALGTLPPLPAIIAAAKRLHANHLRDSLGNAFIINAEIEGVSISPQTLAAVSSAVPDLAVFFGRFDGRRTPPPIIDAARRNDIPRLRALLAAGADPNARCVYTNAHSFSMTPLMCAAYAGHVEAARVLLEAGADTELQYQFFSPAIFEWNGWTATRFAASFGHVAVCKLLLERESQLEVIPGDGNLLATLLSVAAVSGTNLELTKLLLDYGADANRILDDTYAFPRMEKEKHKQAIIALLKQYSNNQKKDAQPPPAPRTRSPERRDEP